ncbi:MAG: DNA double-strand break repair nuclease NurA [Anaerolineae bacterium]|nr:DNA double-strand break repair nuclease NurA [Anaerolineae bacterium]
MSLEFNKVVEQVYKMGAMLEKLDFDMTTSLELAQARFAASSDLDAVRERIHWVQSSDISGYRGAAPLGLPNAEPINGIFPAPPAPEMATILAADGSQVYPDELAPVHYYLINVGVFVYHHGQDVTPEQHTYPDLRYHKDHVHDRHGRLIRNSTVDDRRTVREIRTLAEHAWMRRNYNMPLVTLYDNRLMYLPGGDDAREARDLMGEYIGAMVHLHDAGAILGGYIDHPFRSKRFMQLLYLMSFESRDEMKIHQAALSRAGDLEGLRDQMFFQAVLQNGERSAIMVQSSPQNKEFKDRGENYEIAFFYLKVYNQYQSKVVRVDVPVWVARDPQKVDTLHALLLHQCQLQGRNPYPYAITRADELAWVGGKDRSKLQELVNTQVRRVKQELAGQTLPAKSRGKELARSEKRYHFMKGEIELDER